jgi:hypothetical protein
MEGLHMRTSSERRHNDVKKAIRKRDICKNVYGWEWYTKSLHQYSKGKIHCSCALCSMKTNNKGSLRHVPSICYDMATQKKVDSMNDQLKVG